MTALFNRGGYALYQSEFDHKYNADLLTQFIAAQGNPGEQGIRKSHFFNGRFENIYLSDQQAPNLRALKKDAKRHASEILGKPIQKTGCWFNAMPPGAKTTLHRHDDDDELLSAVYYIQVPESSGALIIHAAGKRIVHTPRQGQWVYFSPDIPHEVEENLSDKLRLSVAFNLA